MRKEFSWIGKLNILMSFWAGFTDKKFKNIFLDIGLMNRVMGIDYNEKIILVNHLIGS